MKITDFFSDIISVRDSLDPIERAWYPPGNTLKQLIVSSDGGIRAYGAIAHAISSFNNEDGCKVSRITGSRSKISSLDVGDNELAGTLLAAKIAETQIAIISEVDEL